MERSALLKKLSDSDYNEVFAALVNLRNLYPAYRDDELLVYLLGRCLEHGSVAPIAMANP